jgi:hypothetical protein
MSLAAGYGYERLCMPHLIILSPSACAYLADILAKITVATEKKYIANNVSNLETRPKRE